jgi:hypothetical protein
MGWGFKAGFTFPFLAESLKCFPLAASVFFPPFLCFSCFAVLSSLGLAESAQTIEVPAKNSTLKATAKERFMSSPPPLNNSWF